VLCEVGGVVGVALGVAGGDVIAVLMTCPKYFPLIGSLSDWEFARWSASFLALTRPIKRPIWTRLNLCVMNDSNF
jgi:hypothetical protein